MRYKVMRLLCMFDLPMETSEEKKAYRVFRKHLLEEGFSMLQYSVYYRICPNREYANGIEGKIKNYLPGSGNVRLVAVTEKQFEDMKILVGSRSIEEEKVGVERFLIL